MKINRLLETVILLLNKQSITAKELAERFEVSTRTIYRDIDDLSAAGIPIYTNQGGGGGIALLKEYTLSKTLLSDEEKEQLLMTLKTLEATQYAKDNHIVEKLGTLFTREQDTNWVEVQFSQWDTYNPVDEKFEKVKESILTRHILCFEYMNSLGEKAVREVCPLKLFYKGQAWYLKGYCKYKESYRIFKISRIKKYQMLEETFDRKKLLAGIQQEERSHNLESIDLTLKFKSQVLYLLYDNYEDEQIVRNKDGTYTVKTSFPNNEWIYSYILSFGNFVEVLEPTSVREEIKKRLRDILRRYEE